MPIDDSEEDLRDENWSFLFGVSANLWIWITETWDCYGYFIGAIGFGSASDILLTLLGLLYTNISPDFSFKLSLRLCVDFELLRALSEIRFEFFSCADYAD